MNMNIDSNLKIVRNKIKKDIRIGVLLYSIVIFVIVYGVIGVYSNLYAQRSRSYVDVRSALKYNVLKGYPGLFDTNVVDNRSLILESPSMIFISGGEDAGTTVLPYLNVDYGVSPSFSLGSNVLLFSSLLSGGLGGSIKARTKVYESSNFIDIVSFYAGGLDFDQKSDSYSLNYFIFSNNASFILTPRSSITLSAQVWSASYFAEFKDELEVNPYKAQSNIEFLTSFIAANYQYSINNNFGLSFLMVCPFYMDIQVDTSEYKFSKYFFSVGYDSLLFRLGTDIRIGRSNYLSVGGAYVPLLSQNTDMSPVVIWGGYAYKFSFY